MKEVYFVFTFPELVKDRVRFVFPLTTHVLSRAAPKSSPLRWIGVVLRRLRRVFEPVLTPRWVATSAETRSFLRQLCTMDRIIVLIIVLTKQGYA